MSYTIEIPHRIVNVLITPSSVDTVLAELAPCLALMPNLCTVQLLVPFHLIRFPGRRSLVDVSNLLETAFSGYRFPSVRRIVLPFSAQPILGCFPEARPWDNSRNWARLAKCCLKVEEFHWTSESDSPEDSRRRIFCMLPMLTRVRIYVGVDGLTHEDMMLSRRLAQETIESLTVLKNLDTVVLVIAMEDEMNDGGDIEKLMEASQKVLAASSTCEKKTLVIRRPHTTERIRSFEIEREESWNWSCLDVMLLVLTMSKCYGQPTLCTVGHRPR
ncbi:hypothetical protein AX15_001490 [Amanita polypyramis BW_CC]|nr:hypothetical protein AX15_001490 [Amanita polypyramis BW_CC]